MMRVLREHKMVLGWTISSIKGISPSICMHKIFIEDSYKLIVQLQWRLNPFIQELVHKEVLKLLEVGIIYPILDSSWVCPVQVVPKKREITEGRLTTMNLFQQE